MAITLLPFPTPAGVVGAACVELDGLGEVLWSARASEELVAGVEELQRLKATAAALEASLLAELDLREVPRRQLGWGRPPTGSPTWPARRVARASAPSSTPSC